MPTLKLESIELDGFRGATKPVVLAFDSEHHITMIFGENGCGKSTIVDGFSFVARKEFGSIKDHSSTDDDFVTALGQAAAKTRVLLKTTIGQWEARLGSGKRKTIVVTPQTGCPKVDVLRRKQILSLIDAMPSDRGIELAKYIDVSGAFKSEHALRAADKETEVDLQNEINLKLSHEQHLNDYWIQEGQKGVTSLTWAKAEAARDQTQLSVIVTTASAISGAVTNLTSKLADWDAYLSRCVAATSEHTKAEAAFQKIAAQTTAQSAELIKVLREAKTFLAKNSAASACPVCTNPINAAALTADIDKRINAMNALDTVLRAVETAKRNLASVEGQRAVELGKITRVIATTAKTVCDADLAAFGIAISEKQAWQDLQTVPQDEERILKLPTVIQGFAASLATIANVGAATQKIANQHNAIVGHVRQVETSAKKVEALALLKSRLAELLVIVESGRKSFVSEVLAGISNIVEDLYNRIHPEESVGGIKLSLDEEFIGSLHLHANFHSAKGITPQSVFSESHLDTLGLCVFIALAKRYSDGGIIILDDVLTSVDASHLDRVITVLHEEAKNFGHTIITTHYRPWLDRYKDHRAPTSDIELIVLRSWSIDGGIRLSESVSSLVELRGILNAKDFNRRNAAGSAGVVLENLLDFLAHKYQCRLPLTGQPHYTMGPLLNCFSKELRKVLRVERLDKTLKVGEAAQTQWVSTPLAPFFDTLKGLALIRNHVGAHYNTLGSDCTDAEVETFVKTVAELAELLVCPQGGDLPDRSKTGSFHHSKSGHVRLFPLEEPA